MSESIIQWHKVVMSELPKEEYINSFVADLIPKHCFICDMPNDNQEILVVKPWGTEVETCIKTNYGYGMMYGSGWQDVIAWANVLEYVEEDGEVLKNEK